MPETAFRLDGPSVTPLAHHQSLLFLCMYFCPRCETNARVIECRRLTNGDKRRRIACQNEHCQHRWTDWQRSGNAKQAPKANVGRRGRPESVNLSDEQLRLILERRDLNNTHLARAFACSRELIRQVRAGLIYRDRLQQIRGGNAASGHLRCENCIQWLGYCSMGFPDPLVEGSAFANECAAFADREPRAPRRAAAARSPAAAAR